MPHTWFVCSLKDLFILFHVPECMYVYYLCTVALRGLEESIESPGTGVNGECKLFDINAEN